MSSSNPIKLSRKLCIVAPVHNWDDVRVFRKQFVSFSSTFEDVVLYARDERGDVDRRIAFGLVPSFQSRLKRFLYLGVLANRIRKEKADIYLFHNPDTLPLLFLFKLFGFKAIYDTHEDFSQRVLMRKWLPQLIRRPVAKLIELSERLAYKFADVFIVTQHQLYKKYGERSLILDNAPTLNFPLPVETVCKEIDKKIDSAFFNLVYVGGINEHRGIDRIIDALPIINEKFACRLALIGPLNDHLRVRFQNMTGWGFVDYHGPLPQREAFYYMSRCDVGMITILDVGDHSSTSPNKLFEYCLMGIPFIASDFALWRDKLNGITAGLFVDPSDSSKIAEAILTYIDDPSLRREHALNGKNYIHNQYNWEREYGKLQSRIIAEFEEI